MSAVEKHQCAGRVYTDSYIRGYACSVNAKYFESRSEGVEPQWFCHHHAPSKVRAKEAKVRAEWEATQGADEARREAGASRARRLNELLGGVKVGNQYNGYSHQFTGGVTFGPEEADQLIAKLSETDTGENP